MKISPKIARLLLALCFLANHSFAQKETTDQKVEALRI